MRDARTSGLACMRGTRVHITPKYIQDARVYGTSVYTLRGALCTGLFWNRDAFEPVLCHLPLDVLRSCFNHM